MDKNIDFLANGMAQGELAQEMAVAGRIDVGMMKPFIDSKGRACATIYNGSDPKDPASYTTTFLNTNATLRRDEWKQLDSVVVKIAESRLGGIQDLVNAGLTFDLGNGMGSTVLESHSVSDAFEADMTMDGVSRSKGDRVVFKHHYLPLPIIHVDYEINSRVLEASRKMGNPLDTTSVERAARKVMQKLENMLFTSTTYSFGEDDSNARNTIYSYTNHPDRNILTSLTAWSASAKTGAQIVADVLQMKQTSINNFKYGPWMLYIPTAYETVIDGDYDTTTPGTTIRERIMKIAGITGIKVVDTLTANNLLLVELQADTVRLVRGLGVQNIEWQTEGKFVNKYKVLTIQVPQIRSDYNGKTGIVHYS